MEQMKKRVLKHMQKCIIYVKIIHYTLETKPDGNVVKRELCALSAEIIRDFHSDSLVRVAFLKHGTCITNKSPQKENTPCWGKHVRAGPQGTEGRRPRR